MATEEREESAAAEIQKKITEAFEVFDHECNKTVDVREIGTIIRSLGCCPNEADLHDMLAEKVVSKTRQKYDGKIIHAKVCLPTDGYMEGIPLLNISKWMIRSIPTENKVEEEEPTGFIRLEKFLPMMTKVLTERRYRPIPEDVLLRAFEVLDQNKSGHLTKDDLVKYMTEEGEPFTQEEMEEMLSAAVDPETNTVRYKDYISMMVVDEN